MKKTGEKRFSGEKENNEDNSEMGEGKEEESREDLHAASAGGRIATRVAKKNGKRRSRGHRGQSWRERGRREAKARDRGEMEGENRRRERAPV